MMKFLGIVGVCSVLLGACTEYVIPEGEVMDRKVEFLAGLSHLEVESGISVVLDDALPVGECIVETNENIQAYVEVVPDGECLRLRLQRKKNYRDVAVEITVSSAQFHSFAGSGGSRIASESLLRLGKGRISLSGGSSMGVQLEGEELEVELSGGSSLNISGNCELGQLECSGGSRMDALTFGCDRFEANVSGGSRAFLNVRSHLSAACSGGSTVRYRGTPPSVKVECSGGSTVETE